MLAAASLGAATAAQAQGAEVDAAADAPVVEEIVITAQRREESLMRVPVAISVLGGAALDKSTSSGVTDALRAVPGVSTLQSYQGGGTLVTIRGVTAGQALFNGAGTVGYYLDSVPFAAIKSAIAPDASAYDLERVEVLRGPQGTLYGASALNGVVRILTAPADPSFFGFKSRLSAATTEGGAASYRGDVSANIPVIADKLAVRATVGYAHEGGWIDTAAKDDFNSGDQWNLRLRVTAIPNDRLTIDLSGWASRGDFEGPPTGESYNFNSTSFRSPTHNRFDSLNAKISYAFDTFTVTSATSYLDYRSKSIIDFSPFAGGFPVQLSTDLGVRVFTEELSASSTGEGPLRWSVGGIYRHAKENLTQALPEFAFDLSNDNVSKSWAGFGELTYVAGPFEFTGGLRYFHDRITQESQIPIGSPSVVVPSAVAKATTPRVVATWHPTEKSSVYLSYSQGFRSGFPQTAPVLPPARPDRLHNYELGAKGTLLDGLLSFDGAIYYIDWKDVQQNITVTVEGLPFAATINGEAASGIGVDAAVAIRPMRGLTLNGSFSWNDLTTDADIVSGGVLLFSKGDRLNYSPKYTATSGFDYAFPLSDMLTGRAAASATYTSRQESVLLLNGAATAGRSDNVFLAKASLAVESREGWTASLYADNITNYRKILNPGFGDLAQYYGRARPRTFGVQLEFKY
ncbi:TonB-dependent receptor [Sphingosinicella microcystinivorans]|uniref:TonB-dependent receptor n=1 Tax=Sphingosinicella microcystinivorans TaxID=335406 RepID=UPI0022F40813|nr:TonB-dependent receptor [Sphingosinicella microcystinivorans]WBX84178.1 TonB-dependent receptor [Sphingosinicella microcystinivorans]